MGAFTLRPRNRDDMDFRSLILNGYQDPFAEATKPITASFGRPTPAAPEEPEETFVGPQPPTEVEKLEQERDKKPAMWKRLLKAGIPAAGIALGGIFGGEAGATGAAQGATEALRYGDQVERSNKNSLQAAIEAAKQREAQQQEKRMALAAAVANQKATQQQHAETLEETRRHNQVSDAESVRYHNLVSSGRSATTEANLRSKGLQYDADGNIIPVPRNLLSQRDQAELDLKEASTDLAQARSEVEKAKSDPTSLQYQLAVEKLNATKQRTQVAAERLGLSKDVFERDTYGTVGGNIIPGGPVDDKGNPIGL
jgi:hypothetical protein